MEVTDVRLRRVETDGRMKAIASITFDGEFVVHDIRIIDGNNDLFVAMPSNGGNILCLPSLEIFR